MGRNKAAVTAEAIADAASHVVVRTFPVMATPDNLPEILDGAAIVIDCLDSLATRIQVESAAHALGLPFVYGSVAGEEGFSMISRQAGTRLVDILGASQDNKSDAERIMGVPTLIPVATAILEANLAVQVLLGKAGSEQILWHIDLAAMQITPNCVSSIPLD